VVVRDAPVATGGPSVRAASEASGASFVGSVRVPHTRRKATYPRPPYRDPVTTTAHVIRTTDLPTDPLALAHDYLRAVRVGESPTPYEAALRDLPRERLRAALDTDDARLAFWTNVYNATVQSVLAASPEAFDARNAFFTAPLVTVAGERLSLDDVEHGLLRGSRPKWGLGYVRNPFPGAFERAFRVRDRDWRIHFALNCGAAACPPIAAYAHDRIDTQLDLAAESYLGQEVEYEPATDVARVPRLLLWFVGDFGGPSGIRDILRRYDCVPEGTRPTVRFRSYDWTLETGTFAPVEEW